ncbi:MAG: hypothetical protein HYU66_00380 [Armatimonadetes bacterium]|nr:hypothetical protein [Armatimonadota bacterium]
MDPDTTSPLGPDQPGRETPGGGWDGGEATALVPRSLFDIIGTAVTLYQRNFGLFFKIAALVYVPWAVVEALLRLAAGNDAETVNLVVAPLTLVVLPLLFLTQGAMIRAISDVYLGNPVSLASCYAYVRRRLWTYIGTMLLAGLLLFGAAALVGFLCAMVLGAALAGAGPVPVVATAMLVAGLVVLPLSFWITFLAEAVLLEGRAGLAAIWRGRGLAAGRWGSIFLLALLGALIVLALQMPSLAVAFAGWGLRATGVLTSLWSGIVYSLIMPFTLGAQILLYYDIRIRKEGFNLETLARSMVSFGG